MIVAQIKKIEDCLASKNVWDLYLNNIIDEQFVSKLGSLGELNMYQLKPKPFFKIIVRGKYTFKGSVGNNSLRLILPDNASVEVRESVVRIFNELFS
jgi:hypothetical protein